MMEGGTDTRLLYTVGMCETMEGGTDAKLLYTVGMCEDDGGWN